MQSLSLAWKLDDKIRRTCMLIITHKCNLNCIYCYEAYKSDKKMDFDTAKKAILQEAKRVKLSKKICELEIDLMGGEPMTNFSLIKQLVEWAEDGNISVPWVFSISTNGTLFTEEAKTWFRQHRDSVSVGLSYDGSPSMQRKNRGETSCLVDLDFFLECWPEQGLHVTISRESLPYFADGILEIQRRGGNVEAALAEGIEWTVEDAKIYKEQLEKLACSYLEDSSLPLLDLLCRPLYLVDPSKDRRKISMFCGSGKYMTAYDIDGQKYGCHMFSPIVLGEKALEIRNMDINPSHKIEDQECMQCVLKHYCPTCAGFNYRYRGCLWNRDKRKCNMHMATAEVSSRFQIKFCASNKDYVKYDDILYAKNAMKAYEILNQIKNKYSYPFRIS